jgi:hypothetical protein
MAKIPANIRSLARSHTTIAIDTLSGIAKGGTNEGARVHAACALLDRGWGKPAQPVDGDGEGGPIVVEIVYRTRSGKK